jgi:hypothetical protein
MAFDKGKHEYLVQMFMGKVFQQRSLWLYQGLWFG